MGALSSSHIMPSRRRYAARTAAAVFDGAHTDIGLPTALGGKLPAELLWMIVKYACASSLDACYSFSLVAKWTRDISKEHLYRSVRLQSWTRVESLRAVGPVNLRQTETFELLTAPKSLRTGARLDKDAVARTLLRDIYQQMTNLGHLRVDIYILDRLLCQSQYSTRILPHYIARLPESICIVLPWTAPPSTSAIGSTESDKYTDYLRGTHRFSNLITHVNMWNVRLTHLEFDGAAGLMLSVHALTDNIPSLTHIAWSVIKKRRRSFKKHLLPIVVEPDHSTYSPPPPKQLRMVLFHIIEADYRLQSDLKDEWEQAVQQVSQGTGCPGWSGLYAVIVDDDQTGGPPGSGQDIWSRARPKQLGNGL